MCATVLVCAIVFFRRLVFTGGAASSVYPIVTQLLTPSQTAARARWFMLSRPFPCPKF